jgi:hypothetical protein
VHPHSKTCRWLTCARDAMPSGYLCEEHLVAVLKGQPKTSDLMSKLVAGLGVGIASSALYEAIRTAFLDVRFSASGPLPDPGRIADELEQRGASLDEAIGAVETQGLDYLVSRRLYLVMGGESRMSLERIRQVLRARK